MTGTPHLGLGAGGEFDRLRAIYERIGSSGYALGDDCALLAVSKANLALSIDLSVEGVHFRREWLTLEEIGWRAASAALSDLAAEGARAAGLLVSLGVPDGGGEGPEVMGGVAAAAAAVGAKVFGEDLARTDRLIVDVCVIGTAPRPVRRIGARPGQGLWVTGELGAVGLALTALQAGRTPDPDHRARFARPAPRIAAGQWLASQGATAMIDISDGLVSDAGHLAAASGVGLRVALERVPCCLGAEPLTAVSSGEEYELLVALPSGFGEKQAAAFTAACGLPLTRVGVCVAEPGVRFTDRGVPIAPPPGFDHFGD